MALLDPIDSLQIWKLSNERQKLIDAAAPSALLSSIGRLEELTSSSSNLFEILLFLDSPTRLSVPKTTKYEKFCVT